MNWMWAVLLITLLSFVYICNCEEAASGKGEGGKPKGNWKKHMRKTDKLGAIAHHMRQKRAPKDPTERQAYYTEFFRLNEEGRREADKALYASLTDKEKKEAEAAVDEMASKNPSVKTSDEIGAIAHHLRYVQAPLDKAEREKYFADYKALSPKEKRQADIALYDTLSARERLRYLKETKKVMESQRPDMRMAGHNVLDKLTDEEKMQVKIGNAMLRKEDHGVLKEMDKDGRKKWFAEKAKDLPARGDHEKLTEYHMNHIETAKAKYNSLSDEQKAEWRERIEKAKAEYDKKQAEKEAERGDGEF
eukprot:TRINITY_DN67938_c1_g7_i1.p1 TRINITY_DN67938_c1_g7~~TRINITY_DN67938_c1_g7_i1.p1  ORF type:complete len:305 (-),score=53.17 TRINITY_DN67938_c1_g7_i1:1883-2797(-)